MNKLAKEVRMLTVKRILAAMKLQRSIGSYDGACFGTSDPSRLRPMTTPPPKTEKKSECSHPLASGPFSIVVLGKRCEFAEAALCPACLADYLHKHSTVCELCKTPIFPGTAVEASGSGYAHTGCGQCAGLYVGVWSEGYLDTSPLDRALERARARAQESEPF